MRYKRNVFHSRLYDGFPNPFALRGVGRAWKSAVQSLLALSLVYSCQMEKKSEPTLLYVLEGKVVMTDSTFVEIPHYADTAYSVFFCVRHAEKRKDQGDNPELTPEGVARAERLGLILSNQFLDKVFSTNYKRTVQTAEIVRKKALKAPPAETFPPAMQDMWLDETLKKGAGKRYLVVGHQNTIPQLLNRLKDTTEFQNIPDDDHGRFYIAVTKGIGQTEVLELRY